MNNFGKFWIKFLISLVIVLAGFLLLMIFVLKDEEIGWGLRYYRYKNQYTSTIAKPKIMITGGSSSLYGVRADEIEKAFGMPAVNLSINGGFSANFLLHQIQQYVRPGDIVLFAADLDVYGGGANEIDELTQYDYNVLRVEHPEVVLNVPLMKQFKYLMGVNILDAISYTLIVELREFLRGPGLKPVELNPQGDYDTCTVEFQGFVGLSQVPVLSESSAIYKLMKTFMNDPRNQGVKFLVSFPARAQHEGYESPEWKGRSDDLVAFLNDKGIVTVGSPQEFIYPKANFCNAYTHLNRNSADKHTQLLISSLKGILNVNTEVK